MKKLLAAVIDFLFPPRCPLCRAYVENAGDWCAPCLAKVARFHILPLTMPQQKFITAAVALSVYHGGTRNLLRSLKYGGKKSTLPYIDTLIRAASAKHLENILARIDIAMPIPLYPAKEKARGFNQTELIFSGFLQSKNILAARLLARTKNTAPMYKLSKNERAVNLKNAFSITDREKIIGKNILLLDDIFTTGATIYECAKILKNNGAQNIYALVLASDHS